MTSVIRWREMVRNKKRRFGSATDYLPVLVVAEDGSEHRALFTPGEVVRAEIRAKNNPEDWPGPRRPWWKLW